MRFSTDFLPAFSFRSSLQMRLYMNIKCTTEVKKKSKVHRPQDIDLEVLKVKGEHPLHVKPDAPGESRAIGPLS